MNPNQFPAQFGQYILLDRLNAGGMAEVFRAKVTGVEGFARLVAIKCMLPQLAFDDQFTAMFIDEARLAAQLSHANVVQIYELGRQAERLYIAMELVQGRDLRHILRTAKERGIPVPPTFSAYVISKAAHGLDYAHRKVGVDGRPLGLIHRDVSPQNILVTYDGEVKVVDFGIAKASAEARNSATQAGVLKGKFAYMAPEQVSGEDVDRRADIFALSSVLFEIVTGSRLFAGDNDLSVLEKVRAAAVPNLDAVLSREAYPLTDVLYKALAQRPSDRYDYASEMAEALETHLIEERSIFGTKRAAQFMQSLYAQEIEQVAELLRSYNNITSDSCVAVIAPKEKRPNEKVFESSFAVPKTEEHILLESSVVSTDVQPRYVPFDPQPTNASRSVHLSKQLKTPETGMRTRPRARLPAPETEPVALDSEQTPAPFALASLEEERTEPVAPRRRLQQTLIDDAPVVTHASRILRRLSIAAVGLTVVLAGIVLALQPQAGLPFTRGALATTVQSARGLLHARFGAAKEDVAVTVFGAQPSSEPMSPETDSAERPKPARLAQPLYGMGYFSLRVPHNSPAVVTIDGQDQGAAPLAMKRLSYGEHDVRVTFLKSGRRPVRTQTFKVDITPDATRTSPLVRTLSVD